MLNFGASDIVEEQQDQSNLRHQAHSDESRLRPYSHQPDSDIYGSESQWSTKLTKSSFQPANQLPEDQVLRKQKEFTEMGVENKGEAPEIITARPEDAFITVLVASDNQTNTPGLDMTSETTVPTDFGQKSSAAEEVTGTGENLAPRRRVRKIFCFILSCELYNTHIYSSIAYRSQVEEEEFVSVSVHLHPTTL